MRPPQYAKPCQNNLTFQELPPDHTEDITVEYHLYQLYYVFENVVESLFVRIVQFN